MRLQAMRVAAASAIVTAVALVGASSAAAEPKLIAGFVGEGLGGTGDLFWAPSDVVVYTGGDVDPSNDKLFVTDTAGGSVKRLDRHGNFELKWGKDVIAAGGSGDTGSGYEVCTQSDSCQLGVPGTREGEFANPQGIAVNQANGHVYVVDRDNSRVQEFDLDGNFVRLWGWGVSTPGGSFQICSSSCRAGAAGAGDGQLGEVTIGDPTDPARGRPGIAVDPTDGQLFVADPGNSRVQQFSPTGAFEAVIGTAGGGLGEFGDQEPQRVAVDSNGILYISDSNASHRIQRYDTQTQTFLDPVACCSPDTADAPLVDGVTVGLEIDPDTDGAGADEEHLLVARLRQGADTVVQELDIPSPPTDPVTTLVESHTYVADPAATNVDLDRRVHGIGVDPIGGNLYLVTAGIFTRGSASPDDDVTFTGCSAPSCSGLLVLAHDVGPIEAALVGADPDATSAVISGSANAGGGVASYRFQLSTDDGESWEDAGRSQAYVSGADDVPVTGTLDDLQPNTLYRVRMVLRKQTAFSSSVEEISNVLTFLTDEAPPDVETLGTAQRTATGVQLRGRVDPNGLETGYWFEYGPAGGPLSSRIPVSDTSAGLGNSPVVFTQQLDGLDPETSYAYRIVASSEAGRTEGAVVGFTTEQVAVPVDPIARGYELVSPADKANGVGVGPWYNGPAASALVGVGAHEGDRFAVQGYLGSVLVDGPYTYSNDWALAERTPAGWVSAPGISRRAHGLQAKADISLNAAAEDLSLMTWGSGGHTLRLFPEMESWNDALVHNVLFMRQWRGESWELFGPTDPAQSVNGGQDSVGDGPKAVAADGSAVAVSASGTRGLAGPGDPTNVAFPDLQKGDSVYLDEITGPFSDEFPGDDGERTLVNVCTAGTMLPVRLEDSGSSKQGAAPCPGPHDGRSARLISPKGASLTADGSTEGAISADGSRVFFMSPDPEAADGACSGSGIESDCPSQVFVWQRNPGGDVTTRWISRTEVTAVTGAAADQDASLMAPVLFEGASRDGDKVFFRTTSPLTADDPNGGGTPPPGGVTTGDPQANSGDLFMYDLPDGPGRDPVGGDVVRISGGPNADSDCNARAGTLRFLSHDGARAYFTCSAPLTGVPAPGSGTTTSPGGTPSSTDAANLYLYDATKPTSQRWRFIARLPRTGPVAACATTAAESCVNGTADGSLITFMTGGALTADEAPGDQPTGDVYGYDERSDELTRLSAPQGGAVGVPYPCAPGSGDFCHADQGITDRALALERLGVAARPHGGDPHGDRLAFFQSRLQLVPEDTDAAYDVYGWRALDGKLSLLSAGVSDSHDAMYVGNDRSGLNVYLATRDRLTWQDTDAVLDVYTARIGGGIPQPPGPSRCDTLGDACQAPGPSSRDTRITSDRPHAGAPAAGRRMRLSMRGLSAKARRRAARTGVLAVRVKMSRPGLLSVTARARVAGKVRKVAGARRRVTKAGTVTVKLRLRAVARRRLGAGRALRVRVTASAASGAATRSIDVTLKRSGR